MLPEQSPELQVPTQVSDVEGSVPADDQSSARKPAETLVTEAEIERAFIADPLTKKYQEQIVQFDKERVAAGLEVGRLCGAINYYRAKRRKAVAKKKTAEDKLKGRRIRLHKNLLFTKMVQLNRISPRSLGMSS